MAVTCSCSIIDKRPKSDLLFSSSRKGFYCSSSAITSAIKPLERDDPNYVKSSWSRRLQLNDPDEYYQQKNSFLFYVDPFGDLSKYTQTGYLRFFINLPKSTNLMISLSNENWAATGKYQFNVNVSKAENGYVEIIIPFKELIKNASNNFDVTKIKYINLFVPENASSETFLSQGEQIHITPFEFWSELPTPPKIHDYINKFYCGNGNKIEVWDRNGVLPESIVVNAFENTLDINVSKDILLQQINHANVISLYTIHLINDTYRSVSKYDLTDEIEIAIPLDKIIYNRYVRAIVIGEETVKEVNLRTENGYLIIQTDTMGDFVFFTGEGQIISTQNEKKETLRVQIDVNHPGIPNYDAEYTVRVYSLLNSQTTKLNTDEFTIYCNISEIIIDKDKICVPASFKDKITIQGVKLYAMKNNDHTIKGFYPLMIKNWSLTFNDEFNGTELDENKWPYDKNIWNPLTDIGRGKTIAASRDAIQIQDGKCILKVDKGTGKKCYHQGNLLEETDYVFSEISTQNAFSQQFGCFTMNVKLPYGTRAGNNTAFWLLIQDEGYATSYFYRYRDTAINKNNYCAEIDIMECSTEWEPIQYQVTEHFWDKDTLKHSSDAIIYTNENLFNGEYAEVSCVWTENALYSYYNGKIVKVVKNIEAYEDSEAYIILSFYGSGYGQENTTWVGSFTDSDIDKMQVSVNHVRAYK